MAAFFLFLALITAAERSTSADPTCNTTSQLCTIDGDTHRTCDGHIKHGTADSCEELVRLGCDCRGCQLCKTTTTKAKATCGLCTIDGGDTYRTCDVHIKNGAAASCDELVRLGCDCGGCQCKAPCSDTCTVDGQTFRTCDGHIKHGTFSSCEDVAQKLGCDCGGCQCKTATTVKAKTTDMSVSGERYHPIVVTDGKVTGNKWTKMTGFRCARDNAAAFWYEEWYYVSIIAHKYSNMQECMDFCENDANCGACDYWPQRPKPERYGQVRSFFLCDLRDQAACDPNSSPESCSYVMLLDRAKKNWVQKSRSCIQDCDYLGKSVRSMHYDFIGIFQGGMLPLYPDSENEKYSCTRFLNDEVSSATVNKKTASGVVATTKSTKNKQEPRFCIEWTATETDEFVLGKKRRESEHGSCFCFNSPKVTPWVRVPDNDNFCTQWTCSQTEVSISYSSAYSSSSYRYYDYNSRYRRYTTDQEITNCACTKASNNNMFCMEWDCQENVNLAKDYFVSWDDLDELETERYVCTGTDGESTVNPNGQVCTRWTGNIVGRHEFELTSCSVNGRSERGYPSQWTCHEDGWHFWKRAWTGVFVPLAPILFLTLYIGAETVKKFSTALPILAIMVAVFSAIILLAGTMCAGLVGVLAGLGAYLGACGIVVLLAVFCSNR